MAHRVVILGGGFGGLAAASALRNADVAVTLVDRRNIHVFQPLLYQVATGGLSPGDISSPLRSILRHQHNASVILADAVGLDLEEQKVQLDDGFVEYDTLVAATGAENHYFGREEWARYAPSLKTLEDAVEIRGRILMAFEKAERESDSSTRSAYLSFVVVGGGATGVELAGALAELARDTLRHDFRSIDPRTTRIFLIELGDHVLPQFPQTLSRKARRHLEKMGILLRLSSRVTGIDASGIDFTTSAGPERIDCRTVLWAAGVRAQPFGTVIATLTGAPTHSGGRIIVAPDLTVPNHPEIFAIGDLAHVVSGKGEPLPGTAPVAMQQGRYVAKAIRDRLGGRASTGFRYRNKGQLATIGRAAAVADLGAHLRFSGYPAWLLWLFVHLMYLVEFQNRVLVLLQWAWHYFTWNRGARIITDWRSKVSRKAKP